MRMTNDQLEAELRDAFAVGAARVPVEAVERLRRVDYRPRVRRRWPLTIGALGAASGTAAVVSVAVLGGSQAAFAGWRAKPTIATAAQSAATQVNCQGYLATMPSATGSWSQVASDVRGPYTVAIYENGTSYATCFTGPAFTFASFSSASGRMALSAGNSGGPGSPGSASSSTGFTSPGGGIEMLSVSHLSLAGDGPYTLAEGRLDPTVSAVTVVLSDGRDVAATTANGWFVAWWPGGQEVTSAQITSASGTTTEPVDVPTETAPPLPPPGSGTAVPANGPPPSGGSGPAAPSTNGATR